MINAHRCGNARPPYAHDFMLYDVGDGERYRFRAMMACRKCGEVREAEEIAPPPIALDDILASAIQPKPVRARVVRKTRRKR